jgi:hypothetical protein
MSRLITRFSHVAVWIGVGIGCAFVSEKITIDGGSLLTEAQARVGRPMTPVSYAGVARRTTRRAVVAGAAAGGAYYGSGCVQVVNAYGQMVYQCP